jgi:hypothetical protein
MILDRVPVIGDDIEDLVIHLTNKG